MVIDENMIYDNVAFNYGMTMVCLQISSLLRMTLLFALSGYRHLLAEQKVAGTL